MRQNLTSIDARFWRIKTVPVLKGLMWISQDSQEYGTAYDKLSAPPPFIEYNSAEKKWNTCHNDLKQQGLNRC